MCFIFLCLANLSYAATVTQAKEFSNYKNKKQIFIQTVLSEVESVERTILRDKKTIEGMLAKKQNTWTEEERRILEKNYEKFKVKNRTAKDLLKKMIVPPPSLILAQAIVESGYGTSKVAKQGNNLFGVTSLSKSDQDSISTGRLRYKRYPNIHASVEDYILTLARNQRYEKLREGIRQGENSLQLVHRLGGYSELGKGYSHYVAKIIQSNSLQNYDGKKASPKKETGKEIKEIEVLESVEERLLDPEKPAVLDLGAREGKEFEKVMSDTETKELVLEEKESFLDEKLEKVEQGDKREKKEAENKVPEQVERAEKNSEEKDLVEE